ncbi:hypothetical protein [Chitinophaga sp.]|uniref:hypothetical protein n=1 Tax=Chitinophaga sp. TaxID=1869181 RepID=UPI002F95D588
MKSVIIYCLLLLPFFANGQELVNYRDTLHNFAVGVPNGWSIWKSTKAPAIKFIAQRMSADSSRKEPENFNVSILEEPHSSVDNIVKKLFNYTSRNPFFKLIDSGSVISNGKRTVWLDEIHMEPNLPDTFFSSIFVSYTDNKAYLLSATTLSAFSGVYAPLFHQIGGSLQTGRAMRKERLKIPFPGTEKWKLISDKEVDNFVTRQYLPENETPEKWDQKIYAMTMENVKVSNIDQAIKSFTDAALGKSANAKVTLLSKENLPGRRRALFKIETPVVAGTPAPESQLYYIIQGAKSFHAVFIAKKSSTLSPEYIKTWGDIFRKSQPVSE